MLAFCVQLNHLSRLIFIIVSLFLKTFPPRRLGASRPRAREKKHGGAYYVCVYIKNSRARGGFFSETRSEEEEEETSISIRSSNSIEFLLVLIAEGHSIFSRWLFRARETFWERNLCVPPAHQRARRASVIFPSLFNRTIRQRLSNSNVYLFKSSACLLSGSEARHYLALTVVLKRLLTVEYHTDFKVKSNHFQTDLKCPQFERHLDSSRAFHGR